MNAVAIQALADVGTVFVSICCSAFIAGIRWGDVRGEVRSINERLAKIEGMFTLRLRDGDDR